MDYNNVLIPNYLKVALGTNDYWNGYYVFHRILKKKETGSSLCRIDTDNLARVMSGTYKRYIQPGPVCEKRNAYRNCFGERLVEFEAESIAPVVIGVGDKTVVENSLTIHPIYGIPYIPGQAVKGMLRSYYINSFFSDEDMALKNSVFCYIFGRSDPDNKGKILFLDAFPCGQDIKLRTEIANNHNFKYYSSGAPVSDAENPNPVTFHAVEKMRVAFSFVLPPVIPDNVQSDPAFAKLFGNINGDEIREGLSEALHYYGMGAKTAIGYGRFLEETAREPATPQNVVQKDAVWLAGYALSNDQKAKIEEKGIHVLKEREDWPRKDLLEAYSGDYNTVLLPSRVDKEIIELSKRLFAHVYKAKKNGKMDCGWEIVKV